MSVSSVKNVKKIQKQGLLKDRFVHQVDDQGFKFGCWRVHLHTNTAAGYYIDQDGKKSINTTSPFGSCTREYYQSIPPTATTKKRELLDSCPRVQVTVN